MQTPSQVASLSLEPVDDTAQTDGLQKGQSLQKIVRFDLKEEGNHILAVSISYTETLMGHDSQAASGRVRTFRKLYQFVAQPCLSVRTKASELPPLEVDDKSAGPYGKARLVRYALEAQLENVGDFTVVIKVSRPLLGRAEGLANTRIANKTKPGASIQVHIIKLGFCKARYFGSRASYCEPARCSSGCFPR